MTWPPIIRVFFAIEFSTVTQDELRKVTIAIKKITKSHHIRWTRAENFHITLKFIPSVSTEELYKLETRILSLTKGYSSPLTLQTGSCIMFPHFFRPRVLALEVLQEQLLRPIADDISKVCDDLQINCRDTKPFRPHVTLGRISHPKEIALYDLNACSLPAVSPMTINHITLFRSEPQSEGSHYTVIQRFPLG